MQLNSRNALKMHRDIYKASTDAQSEMNYSSNICCVPWNIISKLLQSELRYVDIIPIYKKYTYI